MRDPWRQRDRRAANNGLPFSYNPALPLDARGCSEHVLHFASSVLPPDAALVQRRGRGREAVSVIGNALRLRRCRVAHRTGSQGAGDCVVRGQCGCEHVPTGSLPPFQTSDEAVLKEVAELADQHGVEIRTAARANLAAVDAILRPRAWGNTIAYYGCGTACGS
jgi:hypothetical protein